MCQCNELKFQFLYIGYVCHSKNDSVWRRTHHHFSIYCVLGSIPDIAFISCCITIRFLSGAVARSFICTDCHGAFYFGKQTAETNRWDSQSLIWKSNVIKLSNNSWHKCHDLITYMANSFGWRSMLVPPPLLACVEYFYYIENPRDLENSIWLLLLFVYQLPYFWLSWISEHY